MGNTVRFFCLVLAGACVLGVGCSSSESPGPGILGSGGRNASGGSSGGNASGGSNGSGSGSGGDNGGGTGGDNGGGSGGDNGGTGGAGPADAGGGMDAAPPTGTSTGIPRTTAISDLTDDQNATLCDWWNNKQGGYGQSADCGNGDTEANDGSQGECVAGLADCAAATIADFEDCGNAIGTNLCQFRTEAACATLAGCFM